MDPYLEFAIDGLNMEFTEDRHSIPDLLFIDIVTEKCRLIRDHIQSHRTCLILVANIGPKVASIKLFDKNMIHLQLLHFTILNLWGLEPQLYRLWIKLTGVLKDYVVNGHLMA